MISTSGDLMSPAYIAGGLALGVIIGIISGVIGIGGGALLIPALVYMYGMSQLKAQGTSIATLLLPIGIFAFWPYFKSGEVDIKLAALVAVGFAVGGYFGGTWAQHLPAVVLRRAFATLLIVLAAKLLFTK
jgi:uncharacterized membrane protein YfcA